MLFGDVVRLRAIEREDVPAFVRWFNDPEVRRHLLLTDPISRAAEERWFEDKLASADRIFGIEIHEDQSWRLVGNVGLMKIEWKDRVASAGIVIGEKEHWGRGVGRDAMTTLARFAFDELNLHRIELQVLDDNERARRCYAACGFRCEGVRRQAIFRGGRYHDVTSMALLADERGERWRARAGAEQANGVEGRGLPAPNHVPE